MMICKTTNGTEFTVDDEDYNFINQHKWTVSGGYIQTCINNKRIWLHRLLANTPSGMDTDHIDMNGLNNQKSNLRICTRSQNMSNSGSRKRSTSQYKGVCWVKRVGKWVAYINTEKYQRKHLGIFESEQEAARAYNAAAKTIHGDFARLNNV